MNKNVLIASMVGLLVVVFAAAGISKKHPASLQTRAAPASDRSVGQIYNQAMSDKNNGDLIKAKEELQKIIAEHPDYENIEAVQKEIESINMQIISSNRAVEGKTIMHEIQPGDTLGKVAKKYGTTVDFIKMSNNLQSDSIRLGQKLRIWTGTFNIYVDKSQNILMLKDGNEVVKVYSVSTGENNSTPVGQYKVTSKLVDPVWFNHGVVVPPESPQNVLGSRWIGFDLQGYGIHGTVDLQAIGKQVTAGCVRMRNVDVEELYTIIPIGTQVTIVD